MSKKTDLTAKWQRMRDAKDTAGLHREVTRIHGQFGSAQIKPVPTNKRSLNARDALTRLNKWLRVHPTSYLTLDDEDSDSDSD